VFNQLDKEIQDDIFSIESTGSGEKVLNDYKALRNASLTPPSFIRALHREMLPSIVRDRV